MKKLFFSSSFVALTIALLPLSPASAKPSQSLAAFRAVAPANKGRHISAKPGGGLMLSSTVLGNKEIFSLVDLNGGALQDGDSVHIQYDSGSRPSSWRENAGKLARTGNKPDKNAVFKVKWKQPQKTLMLRAASGKWVSGPGKGKDMALIARASDPTSLFELVKNPKSAPKAKPKAR